MNDSNIALKKPDNKRKYKKIQKSPKKKDVLVENAFDFIRGFFCENSRNSYLKIAEYLSDNFFDGKIEWVQKKKFADGKAKSFHQLCIRLKEMDENLPKKSYLYNSLGLHVDNHLLKDTDVFHTYGKLPVSHQIQLLTVHDLEKKMELIREIRDNPCSVRDLKEKIKKIVPARKRSSKGPSLEKLLERLKKDLTKKLQLFEDYPVTDEEKTVISEIRDDISRTIDSIDRLNVNSQIDA
ncbi:MAG: radical SAM protein [uncultured bacterium (gcode 4)]|uniref:Radical SAM protein n=1 Tax=uncultured bacterium (gcode 4) TaxID=1234023 RepID=K2H031_9BACT|nr:MAG: radical SAM protein [uncultured bacterium (gcode 4)]